MRWQSRISRQVITKDYDLKKIAAMVKTRIEVFPDIADHIDFFEAATGVRYCNVRSQEDEDQARELPWTVLTGDSSDIGSIRMIHSNDALYACTS